MKIYRKIKEREKQQRKEEIKTKIISKQQTLIKEASHRQQDTDYSLINVPSESSNSNDDESLIRVMIKCIPKISEEEIQKDVPKHTTTTAIKSNEKLSTIKYHKEDVQAVESDRICCKQDCINVKPFPIIRSSKNESRQNVSKYLTRDDYLTEKYKLNLRADQVKPITSVFEQSICKPRLLNCVSRSESKSVASDPTGNVHMQNILSARSSINSRHKSCKLYSHR